MEKNHLVFYLFVGFSLLFLIPFAEAVEPSLVLIATFLVVGYWGLFGIAFLIFLLKNIFKEFGFSTMLYNLWLFLSLMCVAVGILAIVDDGIEKSQWAAWLILYGTAIGFFNRKEL